MRLLRPEQAYIGLLGTPQMRVERLSVISDSVSRVRSLDEAILSRSDCASSGQHMFPY